MEIICDNRLCGKKFEYKDGSAHFKRAKHHFCSRSCQNTTHGLAGTAKHKIWERTKKRAKEDRTFFDLSVYDIPNIPEYCPVLGIKLRPNNKAGPLDTSPSLDRIIPALGYTKTNVRIISNRANRLRSDATLGELNLLAMDAEKIKCKHSQ